MAEPSTATTSASPPRPRRRWLFRLLVLVAVYAVLGFLVLPPIIRVVAVKQLSKQLDRHVSIRQVKLNPFALSVTVRGLLISDKDGAPFVSWDEVYVNFQLSSFFGKAWVFKQISTTRPFVRFQMNKDYSLNFSDLITKFSTNTPAARPAKPSAPLALRIAHVDIRGASASFSDLTPRQPFKRIIGPLDIHLENFRTDPASKNPYAFSGTTDVGERISWSGYFSLDPLRSEGELTLDKIALKQYAPLYQDLVRFEIRGGQLGVHANYRFEFSPTNRIAVVTNTAVVLRDFKLGQPGSQSNVVDVDLFGVTGASLDMESHLAEIRTMVGVGAKLSLQRDRDDAINVVELSKPPENTIQAAGGVLLLLRSVTNAVTLLLNSTNQWSGTIHNLTFTNCALHLEDLANTRPARLDLDQINLDVKNISNIPSTNLVASMSLRWNTNGSIQTHIAASFSPPTADARLDLDALDLSPLDPYLEPKLNVLILGSRLGLHGHIHLRTPENELPDVSFQGDASLNGFHTVDGVLGEDLLKWDSVRVSGIDAKLNPETVNVREIAIDNAYARVIIETNHTINLETALRLSDTNAPAVVHETKRVRAGKKAAPKAIVPASTNSTPVLPEISISNIVISNAAVRFTDRSVNPNVNLGIEQASGTISDISSKELQHADVKLHARVDGIGPADITGHINPFASNGTNNIKVSIKDVDLTPTSPYSVKFAGYRIAEGKLNMDLTYDLIGRSLKSKNVITLDRFTFGEKVNSPDATHLPVRLAVAILKDRNGQIVLDVPVDGSLDDPQFRVGKVVTRAILNILTKVATSPFSLLGAVFGGGDSDKLGYQDFDPGSAELKAGGAPKLDAMAKALYERPSLQLEIAGSVDPATDPDGLRKIALDSRIRTKLWLAESRSARATNTPDQITLTTADRMHWIKKLYNQAVSSGEITPALIAANTNLTAMAAQLSQSRTAHKGATSLMQHEYSGTPKPDVSVSSHRTAPLDPTEALLEATIAVTGNDLETLASNRAKIVRDYLLATGKVEAGRLFLTESKSTGLRNDGSRVYLQFR